MYGVQGDLIRYIYVIIITNKRKVMFSSIYDSCCGLGLMIISVLLCVRGMHQLLSLPSAVFGIVSVHFTRTLKGMGVLDSLETAPKVEHKMNS